MNNINHIAFVIDASGSMSSKADSVIRVFDQQIKQLANREVETRVSVYFFSDCNAIRCVIFDMDVRRLPSLDGLYRPTGQTALIDATYKAIDDLKDTSQLYGDHAFLAFVLTDGFENDSLTSPSDLARMIEKLEDNWTVAALVPDQVGVHHVKQCGFPADNVVVWDSSAKNIEEIGRRITEATETFYQNRARGIRGTKSLFRIDTTNLSSKRVNDSLDSLKSGDYQLFPVMTEIRIDDFVEKVTGKPYAKGAAFYQLTKSETVQAYKKVCIRNKKSNFIYAGDRARTLLGLPTSEAKISPEHLGKFDVFVQSTSLNRKLVAGTDLLILSNR